MEKNMGKLAEATPYLAMAALAATGVGLAGAGAAAGASAGTAAGAGALGATGTQTGLALGGTLGTSAAVAPEAAFLASLGGSAPLATPLATKAATTTYPFMGGKASILSKPEALQIGSGYEGVSFLGDAPIGSHLDTSYADILKPKGDYAFMGGSGSPEWSALSNEGLTNYAIEDGTKTLMDQLGLGYGDAWNLATQFYNSGNNQANNNASYYNPNNVVSTRRNYEPRPAMSYEIMRRNMRPSKTISSYG